MAKKNNNYKFLTISIILIIVVVFGYFFWIYYSYRQTLGEVVDYGFFKKVDNESIKEIGKLRSCGNWPILIISPNSQRGNPFNSKNIESISVLSTENVDCLPVNLR